MATLSAAELQEVRNIAAQSLTVNYTKPQINAAAQAVEDWLVSNASAISTVINNATTPLVLTVAQKKLLVACVLYLKYLRDK